MNTPFNILEYINNKTAYISAVNSSSFDSLYSGPSDSTSDSTFWLINKFYQYLDFDDLLSSIIH